MLSAGYCTILSRPCSSRFAASLSLGVRPPKRTFTRSSFRAEDQNAKPRTSATDAIVLSAPVAYISESHDPWFNLSYEDWLLRNTPRDQPVLFLYRNLPSVVIGRNQNPWTETTPRTLRETSIPLVRRRSGGGTVYHDMGNTNFSIILPRLLFTRSHGAELVARAIRDELGIEGCGVNERNDVIVRDAGKDYKMTYKIIQHRAYHHGTMLISSSLAELGKSLRSSSPNMQTKAIPSHRSAVTTLNHHIPPPSSNPYLRQSHSRIKHEDFVHVITSEFSRVYSSPNKGKKMEICEVSEEHVKEAKVWKGVEELKSWEWTFGQTPEFSNHLQSDLSSLGPVSADITTRHALITSISFNVTPPDNSKQEMLDSLALSLIGKQYESLKGAEGDLGPVFEDEQARDIAAEVIGWLRRSM